MQQLLERIFGIGPSKEYFEYFDRMREKIDSPTESEPHS